LLIISKLEYEVLDNISQHFNYVVVHLKKQH
jgi:hypothetical protein